MISNSSLLHMILMGTDHTKQGYGSTSKFVAKIVRTWTSVVDDPKAARVYIQIKNGDIYSLTLEPVISAFDDILDAQVNRILNSED